MRLHLIAGTALLLALSVPSLAQDNDGDIRTPGTVGAGRAQGGPAGDMLASPPDPSRKPLPGRSIQSEPEERELEATSAQPIPSLTDEPVVEVAPAFGNGESPGTAEDELGSADRPPAVVDEDIETIPPGARAPTDVDPAPLHTEEAKTVLGTRGGGALAEDQIYPQDMEGMRVDLRDAEEFGEVAGVVMNYRTGRIDTLMISAGGFLGTEFADKIYDVPWDTVATVDKRAGIVVVDAETDQLRPQPEFEREAEQDLPAGVPGE